jgi:hypothetical protein
MGAHIGLAFAPFKGLKIAEYSIQYCEVAAYLQEPHKNHGWLNIQVYSVPPLLF